MTFPLKALDSCLHVITFHDSIAQWMAHSEPIPFCWSILLLFSFPSINFSVYDLMTQPATNQPNHFKPPMCFIPSLIPHFELQRYIIIFSLWRDPSPNPGGLDPRIQKWLWCCSVFWSCQSGQNTGTPTRPACRSYYLSTSSSAVPSDR